MLYIFTETHVDLYVEWLPELYALNENGNGLIFFSKILKYQFY
jgi:hypothetical protein